MLLSFLTSLVKAYDALFTRVIIIDYVGHLSLALAAILSWISTDL
jgi:hypothetical protein